MGLAKGTPPKRVRQITGGGKKTDPLPVTKGQNPGRPALTEPHTLKAFNLSDKMIGRLKDYLNDQEKKGIKGMNMTLIVRNLIESFLIEKGF